MTGVTLRVDAERWRRHLGSVAGSTPGLVPVAKGNGYGFGLGALAREATDLGVRTIAVGTADEVAEVRQDFDGDIVVLMPWRPDDRTATALLDDPRVITTVTRAVDVQTLAARPGSPRVVLEVLTSMRRHGLVVDELADVSDLAADPAAGLLVEGWTIHLPLLADGRAAEAERLARAARAAAPLPLWFSHLPSDEALALGASLAGPDGSPVEVRQRVGTRLWLGEPDALASTATVLDVHPLRRGVRIGYRQRPAPFGGHLLVIAGGTSHGISLEAPTPAASLRQRAIAVATGGLEAAGFALSPYTVAGRKRWFAEPPHMQSSLVLLPASVTPPAVGDEVPVQLRLTTAAVDRVLLD